MVLPLIGETVSPRSCTSRFTTSPRSAPDPLERENADPKPHDRVAHARLRDPSSRHPSPPRSGVSRASYATGQVLCRTSSLRRHRSVEVTVRSHELLILLTRYRTE